MLIHFQIINKSMYEDKLQDKAGSVYDPHSKYSDKLLSVANGSWLLSDMS